MKVLCIDENMEWVGIGAKPESPKFGDIDEVIDEGVIDDLGEYYCLERFGEDIGFSQCHFVPISDIDETEMVREHKLEKV